ncbi:MAG: LCP family protein [Firmicutes bacterium]|nr:LCP family protein [Bacillota bacterium]
MTGSENGVIRGFDAGTTRRPSRKWAVVVLLVFAVFAVSGYLTLRWATALPTPGDSLNILLLGEDITYAPNGTAQDGPGRTDTMILMVVPRRGTGATLISIPRDTLVSLPGHGVRRINAATILGGTALARAAVSNLLGLEVHRHMIVDFNGFEKIVDAVGGVEIVVDKRMKYTDVAGGYSIDLAPGVHMMDGRTALSYVRYRHDALGDISRAGRQQQFMKAVLGKLASWEGLRESRRILSIVREYTQTDLTTREMVAIGWRFRALGGTVLETATLPGRFRGAYWEPDPEGIRALVQSVRSPK